MADLTGFNLDKLKGNLTTAEGALGGADLTKFYLPYLQARASHNESIPGMTNASRDLSIRALERGYPASEISAEHSFRRKKGGNSRETEEDYGEHARISEHINKSLNADITKAIQSNEWVSAPFRELVQEQVKTVGGKGITDKHLAQAASIIGDKIKLDFADRFGRDPTQAETAVIFNRQAFNPETLSRPDDPNQIEDLLAKTGTYEGSFKDFEGKLPLIDQANLNLKNIGGSLTPDDLKKVLHPGMTNERADIYLNTVVEQQQDAHAAAKLAEIVPKRTAAINQLQSDLTGQNQTALDRFTPMILSGLRSRGLRSGPELESILAEMAGRMTENVNAQTTPLRAQTLLEAPQAAFDFALGGAATAGKSLTSAIDFLKSSNILGRQQDFAASESALNRSLTSETSRFNSAMQMALAGGAPSGPGGMDYFLASLGPLAQILSALLNARGKMSGGTSTSTSTSTHP